MTSEANSVHGQHGHSGHPPHGSDEGNKEITIYINTRKFTVSEKVLTYQDLVNLAYPGDVPSPDKVYEITYSTEHGPGGKVGVGGDVKLKEGMVFNVCLTNRS
ncbi:MAG TPA: multiubiquitin domain-containing protein [Parasulfuritortus sp.]